MCYWPKIQTNMYCRKWICRLSQPLTIDFGRGSLMAVQTFMCKIRRNQGKSHQVINTKSKVSNLVNPIVQLNLQWTNHRHCWGHCWGHCPTGDIDPFHYMTPGFLHLGYTIALPGRWLLDLLQFQYQALPIITTHGLRESSSNFGNPLPHFTNVCTI